jgi:transcriptional regulator GlxA family with amidase domain
MKHLPNRQDSLPAKRLKVGFVLAKSFTLSPFALFIDTLRLASDETDHSGRVFADWHVLGSTRHLITSSCGVQIAPTSDFIDPSNFDYIVVVGGLLRVPEPVDHATMTFLKSAAAKGVRMIGVCTGSFILAEAGLLDGHEVCVSWLHYQAFQERFPHLVVRPDRLFHLEGRRGSCAGGSSSADLANVIVERHIGRDAARNALEVLQMDRVRSSNAPQSRQPLKMQVKEPRVLASLITMEQHLSGDINTERLAKSVGLSRRQLERLFEITIGMPPAAAYRQLRLERAFELLTNTDREITEVAFDVGYVNPSHFTKSFKLAFGETPSSARTRRAMEVEAERNPG